MPGPGGHPGGHHGGPGGHHRPPMGGMHHPPMGGHHHPPMGGGMWHRPPRRRGCCGCLFPEIGLITAFTAILIWIF